MTSRPEQSYAELVGNNIKRIRNQRDYTQLKLARLVSVDTSTVSRNENGKGLTIEAIQDYARALNCSENDITQVCGVAETALEPDPMTTRLNQIRNLPDNEQVEILKVIDTMLNFRKGNVPHQRESA